MNICTLLFHHGYFLLYQEYDYCWLLSQLNEKDCHVAAKALTLIRSIKWVTQEEEFKYIYIVSIPFTKVQL